MKFTDKVALITGVASPTAIGFGIAKKFAEEGAIVLLFDIQPMVHKRAQDLQQLGFQAEGFICDLTKMDQVKHTIESILVKYHKIDILVNSAGKSVPPRPPFVEMTEDYLDTVMDRNFRTNFITTRVIAPEMIRRKYGKIVNISSITGPKTAYRYSAAYCAAKGAVSAYTRALALELGVHNITVNSILPGFIDVTKSTWSAETDSYGFGQMHPLLQWPIHSPGFPTDIANACAFLASDEARFITGIELVVDGGATLVEPSTPPEFSDIMSANARK
jgi:3-oxoacyl-[acyl-carrier protein] reductase